MTEASADASDASESLPTAETGIPNTLPPVDIGKPAKFGDGVTAHVTKVRAINAEAVGAGEINGPAVMVTVELVNGTNEQINLGTVNAQLSYGSDDAPALPVTGDPRATPFSGSIKPGESGKGVFIFTIPKDARDETTLTLSYASLSPIVAFQGSMPS